MNKTELVSEMAEKAGISKKAAESALDAFVSITGETMKKGDKIQLIGFGTFEAVKRSARTGVNPLTKEKISVPEKTVPKFTAGASLKKLVK